MKILLIYTNQEQSPYPVYPLGLAYVDACLRRRGFQTRLLDLCFAKDAVTEVCNAVHEFRPDCIGLSIRNIDNLTYDAPVEYLPAIRAVVEACRRVSDAPVVAGGAGFSIFPRQTLRFLGLQVGIAGEGEEAFPAWLERDGVETDVPGLVIDDGLGDEARPPARVAELDSLPFPTRSRVVNRQYELAGGTANVQTKRGCPFRCLYCNYPAIEGRTMRLRSPEGVVEELAQLAREGGVKKVHLVDSVFTYPPQHAAAICEELVRRDLDLHWTCGVNPSSLSPDLAQLMKRAGCRGAELGLDAANDAMLGVLRKGFTMDDVARCSVGCQRAKLPLLVHLIFGAPGETKTTIQQTMAAIRQLRPTAVTYSFGLRIFPGTGLVELLRRKGTCFSDDDLLAPRFYMSPQLAPDTVAMVLDHARREPHWLAPQQRDSAFAKAIMRAGARLGLPGPAWKYTAIAAPIKRAVGAIRARRTPQPAGSG